MDKGEKGVPRPHTGQLMLEVDATLCECVLRKKWLDLLDLYLDLSLPVTRYWYKFTWMYVSWFCSLYVEWMWAHLTSTFDFEN